MARFRRIDVRIWIDDRFRRLSPLPPCGQALWFYLLTGPETVNIPGLYRAGEAALAEALGWTLKAFREAFREVFREGMAKSDWVARVVWIPNAIRYSPPASPNVVTSWRVSWDEIPDCHLKREAFQSLKAFMEGFGEPFVEAFLKGCRNPSANQDLDQDLDLDLEKHTLPRPAGARVFAQTFAEFWAVVPATRKRDKAAAWKAWRHAVTAAGNATVLIGAMRAQASWPDLARESFRFMPYPHRWLSHRRWEDVQGAAVQNGNPKTAGNAEALRLFVEGG